LLACMVSEITLFYCKPDKTSSLFLRKDALHVIFHNRFRKSDQDFLIAFHINFLSGILLQAGYNVIVISPLGAVSHRVCWRNLKERPCFIIMVY